MNCTAQTVNGARSFPEPDVKALVDKHFLMPPAEWARRRREKPYADATLSGEAGASGEGTVPASAVSVGAISIAVARPANSTAA